MPRSMAASGRCCLNPACRLVNIVGRGNIVKHGFFRLASGGRRRRYRCSACGQTFSSSKGTPYYRLQCNRGALEQIAAMSVEGLSISTTAKLSKLVWNTVARRLERAIVAARDFNDRLGQGYAVREIQADEIRTFLVSKDVVTWVMTSIEVWSRFWPATVVGRRSYRNIRRVMEDTHRRGVFEGIPLITTDGYVYYRAVIARLFKHACVYGRVIKTWRKDRVVKVERDLAIGSKGQLAEALCRSEDSLTLNTAFIERLNLTVRQGLAYLGRRSPCHARSEQRLAGHLELLRCHYNFIRPHSALKFGTEIRTPAMQAGLVSRRMTFRDVFMPRPKPARQAVFVLDRQGCWPRLGARWAA